MLRRISSAQTFFAKFVFAPVWIAGFGAGTWAMLLAHGSLHGRPIPSAVPWFFLVAWITASYILWRSCIVLKRVRMDHRALYISNYLKQIEVPLRDVAHVRESAWNSAHPVTVIFERDTAFGRSITFMPTARLWPLWSPHPVVGEILDAAREQRSHR